MLRLFSALTFLVCSVMQSCVAASLLPHGAAANHSHIARSLHASVDLLATAANLPRPSYSLYHQAFTGDTLLNAGRVYNAPTTQMSVSFWVKTTQQSAGIMIFMGRDSTPPSYSSNGFFVLSVDQVGTLGYYERGASKDGVVFSSTRKINTGVYVHVAFVKNGNRGTMYIDGTLEKSLSASNTVSFDDHDLVFGKDIGNGPAYIRPFTGDIHGFQLFPAALTDSQIADIFASTARYPIPSLLIDYKQFINTIYNAGPVSNAAVNEFTLSFWLNTAQKTDAIIVWSGVQGYTTEKGMFAVTLNFGTGVVPGAFCYWESCNRNSGSYCSSIAVNTGSFVFITVVRTDRMVKLYINGSPIGTYSFSYNNFQYSNYDFCMGQDVGNGGRQLIGTLAGVRFYTIAMNDIQVANSVVDNFVYDPAHEISSFDELSSNFVGNLPYAPQTQGLDCIVQGAMCIQTMSIAFWFKTDIDPDTEQVLLSIGQDSTSKSKNKLEIKVHNSKVNIVAHTTAKNLLWTKFGSANPEFVATSISTVRKGEYMHVAVAKNQSSLQLFINGMLEFSFSNKTVTSLQNNLLYLGNSIRTGASKLKGKIRNFKYYNQALSELHVKALSLQTPTVNVDTVYASGAEMVFDGTAGTLVGTIGNAPFSKMTISFWIKTKQLTSVMLASIGRKPASYQNQCFLTMSDGKVSYGEYGVNDYGFGLTSTSKVNTGKYTHIVLVKDGASGNLYINGVLETPSTSSVAKETVSCNNIYFNIGNNIREVDSFYVGAINSLKLYNYVLSEAQISSLFEQSFSARKSFNVGDAPLMADQVMYSPAGNYYLIIQSLDGNVVVYSADGAGQYASSTIGQGSTRLQFQSDGNLVIVRVSDGVVIWQAYSGGIGVKQLVLDDTGNLWFLNENGDKFKSLDRLQTKSPTISPTATPTTLVVSTVPGFSLVLKSGATNAADCDGVYLVKGTLNDKPVYINKNKPRWIGWNGASWAVIDMISYDAILATQAQNFNSIQISSNGNVDIMNSVWSQYDVVYPSFVFENIPGAGNYANNDGTFVYSAMLNNRPAFVNTVKNRFIGWNGGRWAVANAGYLQDFVARQVSGFSGFYFSINGNVQIYDSMWNAYKIKPLL